MAALLKNDLNPYIIRNRWDTAIEGDMFLLAKYVETGQELGTGTPKPAMEQRDEAAKEGIVVTQCPTCKSPNPIDLRDEKTKCVVCGWMIPRPLPESWLKEVARPLKASSE